MSFVKYKLSWRFTDEGDLQVSYFWLPAGEAPEDYVGDILSIVELSAGEYGYAYELEVVG